MEKPKEFTIATILGMTSGNDKVSENCQVTSGQTNGQQDILDLKATRPTDDILDDHDLQTQGHCNAYRSFSATKKSEWCGQASKTEGKCTV